MVFFCVFVEFVVYEIINNIEMILIFKYFCCFYYMKSNNVFIVNVDEYFIFRRL